jgi:hypothetical protein
LISGSIDFSTPAEYATNQLLPYLDNGKQDAIASFEMFIRKMPEAGATSLLLELMRR